MTDEGNNSRAIVILNNLREKAGDEQLINQLHLLEIEILLVNGSIQEAHDNLQGLKFQELNNYNNFIANTMQGIVYTMLGEYDKATQKFENLDPNSLSKLYGEQVYHYWLAFYNSSRGIFTVMSGDTKQGKTFFEAAYSHAKRSGSSRRLTAVLDNLGVVHRYLSNYDIAISYQKRALAIRTRSGGKRSIAITKGNLSELEELRGNYHVAHELALETLENFKELGNEEEIGQANQNVGRSYYHLQDYSKALSYFTEALNRRRIVGNPGTILMDGYYVIICLIKLGQLNEAQNHLEEFENELGDSKVAKLHYELAKIHLYIALEYDSKTTLDLIDRFVENNTFNLALSYIALIQKIKLRINQLGRQKSNEVDIIQIENEISKLKKVIFNNEEHNLHAYIRLMEVSLLSGTGRLERAIEMLNTIEEDIGGNQVKDITKEIEALRTSIKGKLKENKLTRDEIHSTTELSELMERISNRLHGPAE